MDQTPFGNGSWRVRRSQSVASPRSRQPAWVLLAAGVLVPIGASAQDDPRVVLETTLGSIVIELDSGRAPITVGNFLKYVDAGFYDGMIFHRIVRDVLIQTGLVTAALETRQPVLPPIRNEANNRLRNLRGSVAMARLQDPHSAEVQFFINVNDNRELDYERSTRRGWGYAVFGYVEQGMDIVDRIAGGRTTRWGTLDDFPEDPVVIYAVFRMPDEPSR